MPEATHYLICQICGYSIPVDQPFQEEVTCPRCANKNREKPRSARLSFVFSLTALIFYFPANIFPFMTIEMYGNRNSATIWGGIVSLADSGYWPIAFIVFLASILIPLVKLVILFYITATSHYERHALLKTRLYQIVEAIGRWSMLDIFLLAVLVALMKLGRWSTVVPEPGSLLFLLVVIFTMLASAYFDPRLLWDEHEQE